MVEDIKELGSELGSESLLELPVLRHRNIPVAKARVTEEITGRVAYGSERGWSKDRVPLEVAANVKQGVQFAARLGSPPAGRRRSSCNHRRSRPWSPFWASRQRRPSRTTPTRNRGVPGFEIARTAGEVPVLAKTVELVDLIGSGKVVRQVLRAPGCASHEGHDRMDLPTLQKLSGRLFAGDGVGRRKSEYVGSVEIAAPVLQLGIRASDREPVSVVSTRRIV